jgi:hypothetical protein
MVHHGAVWKVAVAVGVAALVVFGCDSSPRKSSAATATSAPMLGVVGCRPPSPLSAESNEVHGSPDGNVSLWGLIFGRLEVTGSGDMVKIVWRMTGSGDLTVVPFGPDGAARPLVFGPDHHTSSSYHRPGEEWGTGFRFDAPGCWRIQLARTSGQANVYFEISPKAR